MAWPEQLKHRTAPAQAGYSGTPLARKLGYRAGCVAVALDAPPAYLEWLHPLPEGVEFRPAAEAGTDLVHLFCTEQSALDRRLGALRRTLGPSASIWVSWPKKAAKLPTDITEDSIRRAALALGLVDIKVCAVTEVWSGLKLVVRKALRHAGGA